MAEVIKSAVIRDSDFFAFIEENLDNIKSLDDSALGEVVFRSAEIKAEVVAKDEKEAGLRAILNYGHTVGHGIETAADFKIAHGEAVAIGMLAAARISTRMGTLEISELDRLQAVIARSGLPTSVPELNTGRIIEAMGHDKKISQGKLRFILPRRIGEVFITDEVSPGLVEKVLVDWHE
jgi:3-dehydroquinate synthase